MDTLDKRTDNATVMLASGELDKALAAFEIAAGFTAMGTQVNMWFILYGVNCLKKPRSFFSLDRWLPRRKPADHGRTPQTDNIYQHLLKALNHDGASHIPLSQLNFMGAGPWILNRILRRKGVATLEQLIQAADRLGVKFKICQVCVDVMGMNVTDDLIVKAEVLGVSSYALDARDSYYNVVI